ncbi:MAG: hypothetical protein MZV64_11710 [Ignavibacteriales bacterium]|nr:hypothetical protein [Ignavibacteriales bacterium]
MRLPLDVLHGLHREPRGLHRARQDHHAAQGPHRHARSARTTRRRSSTAMAITAQEAWTRARAARCVVPRYVREVVEAIAFAARARQARSTGAAASRQRLPITRARERRSRNAERRALARRRVADRAAHLRHLRRAAVAHRQVRAGVRGRAAWAPRTWPASSSARRWARCSRRYLGSRELPPGRRAASRRAARCASAKARRRARCSAQLAAGAGGCSSTSSALGVEPGRTRRRSLAAAGEFVLEGLWAQKKIGRSDDRGFVAPERRERRRAATSSERRAAAASSKKQVNWPGRSGACSPLPPLRRRARGTTSTSRSSSTSCPTSSCRAASATRRPSDWDEDRPAGPARRDPRGACCGGGLLSPRTSSSKLHGATRTPLDQFLQKSWSSGSMREGYLQRERGPSPATTRRGGGRGPGRPAGAASSSPRRPSTSSATARCATCSARSGKASLRPPRHARPRDRRRGLGALEGAASSATR